MIVMERRVKNIGSKRGIRRNLRVIGIHPSQRKLGVSYKITCSVVASHSFTRAQAPMHLFKVSAQD